MSVLQDIYVKPEDIEGELNYDKTFHRWVLDISEIKPMFQGSRSDAELTRKCGAYSRMLYNYLWDKVVSTRNKPFVEWLISCTEQGRNIMFEALKEQAEADAESGIASLRLASPVDLSNGSTINADLLDASIAPMAKEMLNNAYVDFGNAKIYFNKAYFLGVTLTSKDYEEYEY